MRYTSIITTFITFYTSLGASHPSQTPLGTAEHGADRNANISIPLFAELEELSRIVDISYCVGTTGISPPFQCASRCDEFPSFELVDTFNTGPLMSDSCGYIALDHSTRRLGRGRIIVAFRGTYSIANTIVDLSTVPQEYVPYPDNPDEEGDPGQGQPISSPKEDRGRRRKFWHLPGWLRRQSVEEEKREEVKCLNCTVHSGFWTSWQNTRPFILPHLKLLKEKYPKYRVDLVGHSLGGAVAALAGLEFNALGWEPFVTTFGEPRVGNSGLRNYIDRVFDLPSEHSPSQGMAPLHSGRYRRITHVDDPVPLLPLQEWGYRAHAGEVFISKGPLQPTIHDIRLCYGDEDVNCIAAAEVDESWFHSADDAMEIYSMLQADPAFEAKQELVGVQKRWGLPIPARYKIWQLFFAHRDYFWRLGLCVPGGDPLDWGRDRYDFGDGQGMEERKEL
ncbi:Alpha/Beta hydrolase protein [Hyaloscypha sp. PMI_1271]|nr:Alpha/Beta hydrolase protein [Hyaloscypha sp. PMI_1271]